MTPINLAAPFGISKDVQSKRISLAANERINDLEDKIEYLTNDIDELSGDQSRKATAKIKELIAKRKAHRQKLTTLRKS